MECKTKLPPLWFSYIDRSTFVRLAACMIWFAIFLLMRWATVPGLRALGQRLEFFLAVSKDPRPMFDYVLSVIVLILLWLYCNKCALFLRLSWLECVSLLLYFALLGFVDALLLEFDLSPSKSNSLLPTMPTFFSWLFKSNLLTMDSPFCSFSVIPRTEDLFFLCSFISIFDDDDAKKLCLSGSSFRGSPILSTLNELPIFLTPKAF